MLQEWTLNGEEVLISQSGNRVARLIPSPEGPKLLINREEYPLQESCWDVELFHGRNSSMFIFYWRGEVKLSVKIAPLSNQMFVQTISESVAPSVNANRSFSWSQVEAFLMKLYQYLSFKSATMHPL